MVTLVSIPHEKAKEAHTVANDAARRSIGLLFCSTAGFCLSAGARIANISNPFLNPLTERIVDVCVGSFAMTALQSIIDTAEFGYLENILEEGLKKLDTDRKED